MPIIRDTKTARISQREFGEIAFEVMAHVFDIHNEFGRFFDERVYKRELAARMAGLDLELSVGVTHQSFAKTYHLDVLARQSGLFEFKAAESIVSRHRSQCLNYLLLFDLAHGKIINVRPESVGSEFVNCHQRLENLRNPDVADPTFDSKIAGAEFFRDTLISLVRDWGAGLEIGLFDEALTHFFGGDAQVLLPVPVIGSTGHLHDQKLRLIAPDVAFKLAAFNERLDAFETHARKLLQHTPLKAIHWANITPGRITFATLRNKSA